MWRVMSTHQKNVKTEGINALIALTRGEMAKVDRYIKAHIQSPVKIVGDMSSHLIDSTSKRIRPMLTLASAELCSYQGNAHIGIAACVELIHSATLFHDDIVDDGAIRRNRISAHKLWGNSEAVLVGDFVFARAFQIMVKEGSAPVLEILSNASARIAEGEVHQLVVSKQHHLSEETYLEVIRAKTGTLFEAACSTAGALAEKDSSTIETLADFGMTLGIIFQICDDVLDYSTHQKSLGKKTGDDFREKKITLPIILAMQQADKKEKKFWKHCFDPKIKQEKEDFIQAQEILTHRSILYQSIEHGKKYRNRAWRALDSFPDTAAKNALCEAVIFALDRTF